MAEPSYHRPPISFDDGFTAAVAEFPPAARARVEAMRRYLVPGHGHHEAPRRRVLVPLVLAKDAATAGNLEQMDRHLAEAEALILDLEWEASQRRAVHTAKEARIVDDNGGGDVTTKVARSLLRGHHSTIGGYQSTTAPIVAATDASCLGRVAGFGYVVTDGRWGIGGKVYRGGNDPTGHRYDPTGHQVSLVNELRAVAFLLRQWDDTPVTLLVDNCHARRQLAIWQAGDVEAMPHGYDVTPYDGYPATLTHLASRMATRPSITIGEVKGHSGHALNEAADSISRLARRRLTGATRDDVLARAHGHAEAFLATWHNNPDVREGTARR